MNYLKNQAIESRAIALIFYDFKFQLNATGTQTINVLCRNTEI